MLRQDSAQQQNCARADMDVPSDAGFSLLEMVATAAVIAILAGLVSIVLGNLAGHYKLSGDARAVTNSVSVAKLRAASLFTKTRLYVTLSSGTYQIQTWQKTGAPGWVTEGSPTSLSSGVSFGYSSVSAPPPNTQSTIGQAAACTDNGGANITGTACIQFNSRGLPVDSTGAPTGVGAIYLTDNVSVYAVTVAATGMPRFWRTVTNGTSTWARQ